MKVLFVHPGPLLQSELFLRLEPLGLERVAGAARAAGHAPWPGSGHPGAMSMREKLYARRHAQRSGS